MTCPTCNGAGELEDPATEEMAWCVDCDATGEVGEDEQPVERYPQERGQEQDCTPRHWKVLKPQPADGGKEKAK